MLADLIIRRLLTDHSRMVCFPALIPGPLVKPGIIWYTVLSISDRKDVAHQTHSSAKLPGELRKARQANGRAVMQACRMPVRETDEAACVAWLMGLYQGLAVGIRRKFFSAILTTSRNSAIIIDR